MLNLILNNKNPHKIIHVKTNLFASSSLWICSTLFSCAEQSGTPGWLAPYRVASFCRFSSIFCSQSLNSSTHTSNLNTLVIQEGKCVVKSKAQRCSTLLFYNTAVYDINQSRTPLTFTEPPLLQSSSFSCPTAVLSSR